MQDYRSGSKTESLFNIGLNALQNIEKEAVPRLFALDPHKLMRTLEDLSMLEFAKVIIHSSLARKASSMPLNFQRIDFPAIDPPEWNKFLTIKLENDKVKTGELPQNFWGDMKQKYEAHNKDYTGVYQRK
jgi:succinate dehydrogenase/fumarate reductase flavoprotein subunit